MITGVGSRPFIDHGAGRFRLIESTHRELKEEEVQDASKWGGPDDQIDSVLDQEPARAPPSDLTKLKEV